ncbi:hypothetical protein CDAR_52281 [Caerostris darwini]|uniref:Uncharacterized protein n=1 Tax=Caerostris darwini TaxID=1538125 RepID=A0AAV4V2V9_9ARAC|nr:hypothetical protein CDAR_52281 [Caerostris darwini]
MIVLANRWPIYQRGLDLCQESIRCIHLLHSHPANGKRMVEAKKYEKRLEIFKKVFDVGRRLFEWRKKKLNEVELCGRASVSEND